MTPMASLRDGRITLTRKAEDYVMRSFYNGNDVIVGRARTYTLI